MDEIEELKDLQAEKENEEGSESDGEVEDAENYDNELDGDKGALIINDVNHDPSSVTHAYDTEKVD